MQELSIRSKMAAFFVFMLMMAFSVWAKQQEAEKFSVQQTAGNIQTEELPKRIALTFDDGPHPVYTKQLLDGLRERGVQATFFVVGENIPGHEDLIERMYRDGHLIGNHTYDHSDLSRMSSEQACEELTKTSNLVQDITGRGTSYVRPPFGNWNDDLDCRLTMISVKWTIDPLDWTTQNKSQVVQKVVSRAEDNDIILLHDYYKSSVEAALEIVDILEEQEFEFVTVEELLLE
ncbi:MAG: polysaccharide deacetylase family protein [Eubacteriales bacterium]|nr:polysaccharide deacetylase family protein [Eubacteriales bacterium]